MWRLLRYTFSGICLLLAAATVVLWARSYRVSDVFGAPTSGAAFFLCTRPGTVCFFVDPSGYFGTEYPGTYFTIGAYPVFATRFRYLTAAPGSPRALLIEIPLWVVILPPLVPPLLCLVPWLRRRRRRRLGLCLVCGYDLRASPERCPECGTVRPGTQKIVTSADKMSSATAPSADGPSAATMGDANG